LSDRIENLSISIARMRNTSLPRCASTWGLLRALTIDATQ
jgi:hypothetical protein